MIESGILKTTSTGVEYVPSTPGKSSSTKRKHDDSSSKRGRPTDIAFLRLPPHGYPLDHPYNEDGYRYWLAEPDPNAPFLQEFDEGNVHAGKLIPSWLYRVLVPDTVLLALHDRTRQLKISEDRLSITGDKGFGMARSSHWIRQGCWYWEAYIEDLSNDTGVRLGWGQDYCNLQKPLGHDTFGYSWCSIQGTRFHQAIGKYYSPGYKTGDTVGFLINIPTTPETSELPNTYRDRPVVKFGSHLYYKDKDNIPAYTKTLKPIAGSEIIFFKNGVSQGVAFQNIYTGNYYPAVSMYKGGTIKVNFGPDFKHPPSKEIYNWRGMHERPEEMMVQYSLAESLFFTEHMGKLQLDDYVM